MKITVVTVTRQAANILEKTICSVLTQTRLPDEYIIIDGGSDDGTVDVIRHYQKHLAFWVSEPDKGIYNAMNKAISYASGDWILFMNAADVFVQDNVLERIAPILETVSDKTMLVYGDCLQVFPNDKVRYNKALPTRFADRRMICSHQSLFSRQAILKQFRFEEEYLICADHYFVLKTLSSGYDAVYVPFPVGKVQLENYSWPFLQFIHQERWQAVRKIKRSFAVDCYFSLFFARLFLGSIRRWLRLR